MILIIDDPDTHGLIMKRVIKDIADLDADIWPLSDDPSRDQVYDSLNQLLNQRPNYKFLLLPWICQLDLTVDKLVHDLCELYTCIGCMGNQGPGSGPFSPRPHPKLRRIGCWNKLHRPIRQSTPGELDTIWVVGTSYHIDNEIHYGSSIAAAIYTAYQAQGWDYTEWNNKNTLLTNTPL